MLTSALLACVPSLMPRVAAICVCSSIMPGVMCFPRASMVSYSGGFDPNTAFGSKPTPTARISPACNTKSAPSKIPDSSQVQMVAFSNQTVRAFGRTSLPYAVKGKITFPTRVSCCSAEGGASAIAISVSWRIALQSNHVPSARWPFPSQILLSLQAFPVARHQPSIPNVSS